MNDYLAYLRIGCNWLYDNTDYLQDALVKNKFYLDRTNFAITLEAIIEEKNNPKNKIALLKLKRFSPIAATAVEIAQKEFSKLEVLGLRLYVLVNKKINSIDFKAYSPVNSRNLLMYANLFFIERNSENTQNYRELLEELVELISEPALNDILFEFSKEAYIREMVLGDSENSASNKS